VEIFVPMLVLGLVTSLHCVSMCGPMVITYALKETEGATWKDKLVPNFAYQSAKILSYMIVGLALGAIGGFFDLEGVRPYVMVLAGGFMIVLALGMTGRFPWAARLTPRPPKFLIAALRGVRRKAISNAEQGQSPMSAPILFGLLTGLMPCAPLIAAQLQAIASGNPLTGALGMMAFGLGTAPLMFGFGVASSMIPAKLKSRVMVVLAIVVLLFGVTYLNRGAMLLGSPVTLHTITQSVLGGPAEGPAGGFVAGPDGVVEIPLVIADVRFEPSALAIPVNQPVRLVVDRQEDNPCSDQLAIPQLGVLVDLEPFATTVVELPPVAPGNYTLTCGMGMMPGSIVAGQAGAQTGVSPLLVGLFILAAAVLGWMTYRQRVLAVAGNAGGNVRASATGGAEPVRYFGFTVNELVVIAALLVLAIAAGQLIGGL